MSYFGRNIKKIRIAKKMSQTFFAQLFNLKRTTIGAYEEGRAEPKIETAIKIADYFELTLEQLFRKELTVNEIFHFRQDLLFKENTTENKNKIKQLQAKVKQLENKIESLRKNTTIPLKK